MVATFESALSSSGNKRTDSRLLRGEPLRPTTAAVSSRQYVSPQQGWYRMDWGTGGNVFPAPYKPSDSGKPWNSRPTMSTRAADFSRPAHLFAPLGETPRSMRNTLDSSLSSGGWTARTQASKWATELLPPQPGRLAQQLSGHVDKSGPMWNPAATFRSNCKPLLNTSPIHSMPLDQVPKIDGTWRTTSFEATETAVASFGRFKFPDLDFGN